ncbi:putative selenate reductase subunit YgfK [Brachyspira innocens]|uniref:dihydrouracil dehydrogenase (NAD(+)) n=1 Tax=Brachyspira innocens TaxID=13264 RepID=A0ABT8YV12_9SPIR|nr:putative selenate reductase subunit YgfK [Brachyspira innocens]MDO6992999.1 putative selenate reductase subunit YgfK [Brachyspira innocens]MDO7019633.1 putative selenate reductase subunit YgfK [Brachyspira innocens]
MSDVMTPIPFGNLMNWVLEEKKTGKVFGISRVFKADKSKYYEIFGRKLETPIGPAAGPHTQLAQNIIAAYYTGSRFFELKTVQKMDGEELSKCVAKPCIAANDECYNCEWSTELYVPQAFDEYVKAWVALKVIAKEWDLGDMDGFQFNMSVGYDYEGIKLEKIDKFIEGLKDASNTPIFKECIKWLNDNIDRFKNFKKEDIDKINADVCNSVTLSTLHGCPPTEIEKIASYLITEKKLNTFVKCNPTLLGYEYARKTLDDMGYDYISFTDFHFKDDLQYSDAVPMLQRLQKLASDNSLLFGVKITNTFPVDVKQKELPSEEMYMSGKSLFPLSMTVASRLSKDFDGNLRISYSGGCDYFNINDVIDAGIWPVTIATTLLKTGGYQRTEQIAKNLKEYKPFTKVDVAKAEKIVEASKKDKHHTKPIKPLASRKIKKKVPLVDCYTAPCMETCPIHQDLTTYIRLNSEGKYDESFKVIIEKNAMPFATGILCPHTCMDTCTRQFYEEPVSIRACKLEAARVGYKNVISALKPAAPIGKKAGIIGAGPAGLSAAFFLARAGVEVTVFDKREKAGGVVANIIPNFRISSEEIGNDVSLCKQMGVKFELGKEIKDIKEFSKNYDYTVVCIGAHKNMPLKLEVGETINALKFLEEFNKTNGNVDLGEDVVVIGGGNTAMDAARAAKKNKGVKNVRLVYRRTKRYMPALEEELKEALEDGVEFMELLAPVKIENGKLLCKKMELSDYDEKGRRNVVETKETVEVPASTVIASIGEQIESEFYKSNGIEVDERGKPKCNANNESSLKNVYIAGDGLYGAATIVEAIRDAKVIAEAVLGKAVAPNLPSVSTEEISYSKKGNLKEVSKDPEASRCLTCDYICESCAEVCPNRANISVKVEGGSKISQIIHVDYMCNECGNCETFCPYSSAPYKDKFTLFATADDMKNSKNDGFLFLDKEGNAKLRIDGKEESYKAGSSKNFNGVYSIVDSVFNNYKYLILK